MAKWTFIVQNLVSRVYVCVLFSDNTMHNMLGSVRIIKA